MEFDSKNITSNQAGVHENLEKVVRKHIASEYKKPFQQHNLEAFETLQKVCLAHSNSKLILDSCCGTGMSSRSLASQNPDALVIGVDQSCHRLNKQRDDTDPDNLIFLQANCEDIWRLCVANNIMFDHHYILYPNPYPKSVHFKRRWHGHAVFPSLLKLSSSLELRSNWKLYLEEFAMAWQILSGEKFDVSLLDEGVVKDCPITLFERKYAQSGQTLYQLIIR